MMTKREIAIMNVLELVKVVEDAGLLNSALETMDLSDEEWNETIGILRGEIA